MVIQKIRTFVFYVGIVISLSALMVSAPIKDKKVASWYGGKFHGRTMANGKVYNMHQFTAAHKTLPFDTCLFVAFKTKSVYVRITDRGPYVEGREIDLSMGA